MPALLVKLFAGRSEESKREYATALTEATVKVLGCKPEAVDIIFEDVQKSNWAHAGILWSDRDHLF